MNWLTERDVIKPRSENFRDFGHNDKFTKKARGDIVAKNNYTCRFCGGVYPKYLICSYITYAKCDDVCCRACHLVTHLNAGFFREMKLYYSKVPQIEIIRKTVDFIIENDEMPLPTKIDKDVKLPPISLLEFINIINNNDTVPNELENYKLFFTHKLNVDFIVNNYGNKMLKFIDDKKYHTIDTDKMKIDDTLDKHVPTDEELALFNKYYA